LVKRIYANWRLKCRENRRLTVVGETGPKSVTITGQIWRNLDECSQDSLMSSLAHCPLAPGTETAQYAHAAIGMKNVHLQQKLEKLCAVTNCSVHCPQVADPRG